MSIEVQLDSTIEYIKDGLEISGIARGNVDESGKPGVGNDAIALSDNEGTVKIALADGVSSNSGNTISTEGKIAQWLVQNTVNADTFKEALTQTVSQMKEAKETDFSNIWTAVFCPLAKAEITRKGEDYLLKYLAWGDVGILAFVPQSNGTYEIEFLHFDPLQKDEKKTGPLRLEYGLPDNKLTFVQLAIDSELQEEEMTMYLPKGTLLALASDGGLELLLKTILSQKESPIVKQRPTIIKDVLDQSNHLSAIETRIAMIKALLAPFTETLKPATIKTLRKDLQEQLLISLTPKINVDDDASIILCALA